MDSIIKLEHVNKKFGSFAALTDVSIDLQKGKIYGLIGKNGAGKTTMMRLITGLSFPTSGNVKLFGHENWKESSQELHRIGSLIEYPSLNGSMTARENMKYFCMLKGVSFEKEVESLLEMVDLAGTGNKKVKDFSLGMRQRLGIAVAVLGNPEMLILDEPVNGLDPIGIVEIRNLIKKLSIDRKMTVLISSHNLPELYQTATDYIIVDKGRVLEETTLEELEKHGKDNLEEYFISVIQNGHREEA